VSPPVNDTLNTLITYSVHESAGANVPDFPNSCITLESSYRYCMRYKEQAHSERADCARAREIYTIVRTDTDRHTQRDTENPCSGNRETESESESESESERTKISCCCVPLKIS